MNVQRFGLIRWGGAFTRTGISYWFSAERGGVCVRTKSKVAGGSPAAGYFSCAAKRSNQEKAAPAAPPPDGGTLRYSKSRAAAQLGLARSARGLRQSSPKSPGSSALLGGTEGEPLGAAYRWCNAVTCNRKLKCVNVKRILLAGHAPESTAHRHHAVPSDPASNAAESGDVGEHCLRPRALHARPSCAAARLGE